MPTKLPPSGLGPGFSQKAKVPSKAPPQRLMDSPAFIRQSRILLPLGVAVQLGSGVGLLIEKLWVALPIFSKDPLTTKLVAWAADETVRSTTASRGRAEIRTERFTIITFLE